MPVEIGYRFRNREQLCLSKVKVMNTEKFTGQTQQTCRKRPTARAAPRCARAHSHRFHFYHFQLMILFYSPFYSSINTNTKTANLFTDFI